MTHEHTWEPMHGWSGRYRCEGEGACFALGYRGLVIPKPSGKRSQDRRTHNIHGDRLNDIVPYVCSTTGCRGWAVGRKPRNYCRWHNPNRKKGSDMKALWIGGPPGATFKNIKTSLAEVAVEVVDQWDDHAMRKSSIPSSIEVVLINKDMIRHGEAEHVRDLAKRDDVAWVWAHTSTAKTIENMRELGILPPATEEKEKEVAIAGPTARQPLAPVKQQTRKLVERDVSYALRDILIAAGLDPAWGGAKVDNGSDKILDVGDGAIVMLTYTHEEVDDG